MNVSISRCPRSSCSFCGDEYTHAVIQAEDATIYVCGPCAIKFSAELAAKAVFAPLLCHAVTASSIDTAMDLLDEHFDKHMVERKREAVSRRSGGAVAPPPGASLSAIDNAFDAWYIKQMERPHMQAQSPDCSPAEE